MLETKQENQLAKIVQEVMHVITLKTATAANN